MEISDDVREARAVARTIPGVRGKSWDVDFGLGAAGTRARARLTRRALGRRLADVVDGVVVSAPTVQGIVTSGRGQIAGHLTKRRAREIAATITAPELPA